MPWGTFTDHHIITAITTITIIMEGHMKIRGRYIKKIRGINVYTG
jgi:hypothetical protein